MTQAFDLSLSVLRSEISTELRHFNLIANDADLSNLIERFKIISLSSVSANLSVFFKADQDSITVSGHINAKLQQQCIVTLAPVDEVVDEDFELILVTPEVANQFDDDEVYLDPNAPDYDALEGDVIALGEIVAQTLSVMMNPYPRQADAEIQRVSNAAVSVNEELEKKPNPFAILSKLSDES